MIASRISCVTPNQNKNWTVLIQPQSWRTSKIKNSNNSKWMKLINRWCCSNKWCSSNNSNNRCSSKDQDKVLTSQTVMEKSTCLLQTKRVQQNKTSNNFNTWMRMRKMMKSSILMLEKSYNNLRINNKCRNNYKIKIMMMKKMTNKKGKMKSMMMTC